MTLEPVPAAPDSAVCGIDVCVSWPCDIRPHWCRVWNYARGHNRSPANAAFLREMLPASCLSVDARGNVNVDLARAGGADA